MNGKLTGMARFWGALAGWILLASLAAAQPPTLMHYQGRLTNSSGIAITTAQTVYFSLWSGGSATTASSGTRLYREHATITPGSNGIFEHLIGSGTVDNGTLSASLFNTSSAIYLQVDIGSATLLPRARITSVGYSFYAAQAATAVTATQAGTPRVTSVTDTTGGNVVIGDKLQISGSGLTGAKVTVGGRTAPIVSISDTVLTCLVPAGIPMGMNPVSVIDAANSLASVTVAHVNVHRLLVWVAPQSNPQITIFDALTQQVVVSLNPYTSMGIENGGVNRLQMAFANEGSLALIPNNSNGAVYAIDLTANPPSLLNPSGTFISSVSRANAVAVSPDNYLMVVSDVTGSRLSMARIGETAPPYSSSAIGSWIGLLPAPTDTTNLLNPRGSAFVGNGMFVVCSAGNNRLFAYRRTPGTSTFTHYEPNVPATPGLDQQNEITVTDSPFMVQPTRDLTRLFVMTYDKTDASPNYLDMIYTAPEGFGDIITSTAVGGAGVWGVGLSPEGNALFLADAGRNVIQGVTVGDDFLSINGETENQSTSPDYNYFDFLMAAMEPGEGRQIAVGTNYNILYFYSRDGGTLRLSNTLTISNTNRYTYELQYQP